MSLILLFISLTQANAENQKISTFNLLKNTKAPISKINVSNIFPHDPESFTQGLVYHRGYLYESTGLNGNSALKKVELNSGKVIKKFELGKEYFGEGMAIFDKKIYQLTWLNQTGFIYDLSSFKKTGRFSYQGEGWGLTSDGKSLIMSNGTPVITFSNPKTFKVIRRIQVRDGKMPVKYLNELEFIRGEIWANVFTTDVIARISPQTGKVLGWIDLSSLQDLLPPSGRRDVLNGIAYDPEGDRIFVTGKLWPRIFEIKVIK
ncbi:MAG: glutaminyl-peptide cyclotransferase [Smithella sp.]|nr:glutaminyl-peptide cyclotransferase [Syntrophaceae bacterium]